MSIPYTLKINQNVLLFKWKNFPVELKTLAEAEKADEIWWNSSIELDLTKSWSLEEPLSVHGPFPSSLLHLFQSESASEVFFLWI